MDGMLLVVQDDIDYSFLDIVGEAVSFVALNARSRNHQFRKD